MGNKYSITMGQCLQLRKILSSLSRARVIHPILSKWTGFATTPTGACTMRLLMVRRLVELPCGRLLPLGIGEQGLEVVRESGFCSTQAIVLTHRTRWVEAEDPFL